MTELTTDSISKRVDHRSTKRYINGVPADSIRKYSSNLEILHNPNHVGLLRHSAVPAESMTTWEFVAREAQDIFPDAIRKKLFGPWGKAQVAPILDRNGKSSVYYQGDTAVAFSEMVGVPFKELTQILEINNQPLFDLSSTQGKDLWLASAAYSSTGRLLKNLPSLDPDKNVEKLQKQYWTELSRLNPMRRDIQQREVLLGSTWGDTSINTSLSLIQTGHALCEELATLYNNLARSDSSLLQNGVPAKNIVLSLLQMHQASVQEMILSYLGVNHRHLHFGNFVSKILPPDSEEAKISPLATSIIDFDMAKIDIYRLAQNPELYTLVDGEYIKTRVKDQNIDPHLRMQFAFYLPLSHYDDEILEFIRTNSAPVKGKLANLISLRTGKEITERDQLERLERFTDLVSEIEKEQPELPYPLFTQRMLKARYDLLGAESNTPEPLAKYYAEGILPETDDYDQRLNLTIPELSPELLLLSAIYERHRGADRNNILELSQKELHFVVSQLKNQDSTSEHAHALLKQIIIARGPKQTMQDLFLEAKQGEVDAINSAKDIMASLFLPDSKNFENLLTQEKLINMLMDANLADVAIDMLDLDLKPKETAIKLYDHIRRALLVQRREKIEHARNKLLSQLDQKAKDALGYLYVARQKVGSLNYRRLSNYTKYHQWRRDRLKHTLIQRTSFMK